MISDKSLAAYEAVLMNVKRSCPEWNPEEIITDFNEKFEAAIRQVFPNPSLKVVGSYYSFLQVCKTKVDKIIKNKVQALFKSIVG